MTAFEPFNPPLLVPTGRGHPHSQFSTILPIMENRRRKKAEGIAPSGALLSLVLLTLFDTSALSAPGAEVPTFDYHRLCKPSEGRCAHWEGLSCGEVDAILLNVRRYEKQVASQSHADVVSSPISLAPPSLPPAADAATDARPRMVLRGSHASEGLAVQAPRHILSGSDRQPAAPLQQPSMDGVLSQGPDRGSGPSCQATGLSQADGQQAPTRAGAQATAQVTRQHFASPASINAQQARTRNMRAGTNANQIATGRSNKAASFPVVDTDGHTKYRLGDGLEPSPAFPRGRCVSRSTRARLFSYARAQRETSGSESRDSMVEVVAENQG